MCVCVCMCAREEHNDIKSKLAFTSRTEYMERNACGNSIRSNEVQWVNKGKKSGHLRKSDERPRLTNDALYACLRLQQREIKEPKLHHHFNTNTKELNVLSLSLRHKTKASRSITEET